jgi:hypothetical protein
MGAWMREVRTYQVQIWLEEIAEMHKISKTTLAHVKNFLSGVSGTQPSRDILILRTRSS